jgi:hypothetical protein
LLLVDTVYADVLIPFSYVTSTVYKQDVQISPQYPESIIRIEVKHKIFTLLSKILFCKKTSRVFVYRKKKESFHQSNNRN